MADKSPSDKVPMDYFPALAARQTSAPNISSDYPPPRYSYTSPPYSQTSYNPQSYSRSSHYQRFKPRSILDEDEDYSLSTRRMLLMKSRLDTADQPVSITMNAREPERTQAAYACKCSVCNIYFLKRSILEHETCGACYRLDMRDKITEFDKKYIPQKCTCIYYDCLNYHEKDRGCIFVDNYGSCDICVDCKKGSVRLYVDSRDSTFIFRCSSCFGK